MMVFIGWSALPQSTPIHLNFISSAHLWKRRIRAGMLHEVADFVRTRLVPGVLVIAGVDDQDVALA